jgi:S-(hydroxymethyl)glutathione dehydrogenase / alcohol dehydrogenase
VKAAILEEPGRPLVLVDDVEIESPHPGEVAVRVVACSLCHSDLNFADGLRHCPLPAILGHEAAGVVETIGAGVSHLAPGDHVVLSLRPPCRSCYWCVRGQPQLCPELGARGGVFPDGGTRIRHRGRTVNRGISLAALADVVVTPASGAIRVPDHVPLDLVCLLGCGVQTGVGAALNSARVQVGDTVVITGLGTVGLSAAIGARIAGAALIIGVDTRPQRRKAALELGTDYVVDPAEEDLELTARDLTHGIGADVGLESAGSASLVDTLLRCVRPGGTVAMAGSAHPGETVTIPASWFSLSERMLKGCFLGSSDPARDIPRLVGLWDRGLLPLEKMVTARRPFEDVNQAMNDLRTGAGLRTVIMVGEPPAARAQ